MACREVEQNELVAKYVSGQLDPAAQDDFEIHILECESCLASVETLQAVREDLVTHGHRIRAYSSKPPGNFRWLWGAIPAFCVLVVAVGALQWTRLRHLGVQTAQVEVPAAKAVEKEKTGGLNNGRQPANANIAANHRAYINFGVRTGTHASTVPRDNSRSSESGDQHGRPHAATPPTTDVPSVPAKQSSQPEDIVALLDKLKLPHSLAQDQNFLAELAYLNAPQPSIEDAKQRIDDEALDHLASVQAPPFAFSGVAGGTHSSDKSNSIVASGAMGADLPAMTQTLFHNAMLAYAEKRYADAEALLQDAIQTAPGSADINFYLAMCRLVGDRANEAVEPLQFVLTKENSPYLQSAHFYLGKAYLQMRDTTRAQAELESAAGMPGRLTGEAKSALARLRAVLVFESEKKDETVAPPDRKN